MSGAEQPGSVHLDETTPRLRARINDEIGVTSGAFLLSDAEIDRVLEPWSDWPEADESWLVTPHPQGTLFRSGATYQFAAVRIEIWTGRPPGPPDGDWEAADEGDTADGDLMGSSGQRGRRLGSCVLRCDVRAVLCSGTAVSGEHPAGRSGRRGFRTRRQGAPRPLRGSQGRCWYRSPGGGVRFGRLAGGTVGCHHFAVSSA